MNGVGLIGAHRTGKTTLARTYADEAGINFVETNVSSVFQAEGFDPQKDYPFTIRLKLQEKILDHVNQVFSQQSEPFITDRTPIDVAAYLIADIMRENVYPEDQIKILQFINRAVKITNESFHFLVLVQPGIPIINDPMKGPPSIAYMEHLNFIMRGIILEKRVNPAHIIMSRGLVDLEQRVELLSTYHGRALGEQVAIGQQQPYLH